MRVCILGSGLSALTLAKALVNIKINVDLIISNKAHKIIFLNTIFSSGLKKNKILVPIIANKLFLYILKIC